MFPAWDKNLFRIINESHTGFGDIVMQFLSDKFVWIPLYAALIYLLYRTKPQAIKAALFYVVLAVIWADQISSSVLKPFVKRLRPSHVAEFKSWIHLPNGEGGLYGFCSSHAANAFAVACCIFLLTKNKSIGIPLFIWAALVSYSRIYLGVHYPLDVITGAFVGISGAWILKMLVYDKLTKNS
jgi:undecaprenyl-diphosphatase